MISPADDSCFFVPASVAAALVSVSFFSCAFVFAGSSLCEVVLVVVFSFRFFVISARRLVEAVCL